MQLLSAVLRFDRLLSDLVVLSTTVKYVVRIQTGSGSVFEYQIACFENVRNNLHTFAYLHVSYVFVTLSTIP